jgi:hypothetical protein
VAPLTKPYQLSARCLVWHPLPALGAVKGPPYLTCPLRAPASPALPFESPPAPHQHAGKHDPRVRSLRTLLSLTQPRQQLYFCRRTGSAPRAGPSALCCVRGPRDCAKSLRRYRWFCIWRVLSRVIHHSVALVALGLSTPYGLPRLEQGVAKPATRAPIFCCPLEAPCNGGGGTGHGWDPAQPEPCLCSLLPPRPRSVYVPKLIFSFFCFFGNHPLPKFPANRRHFKNELMKKQT